MKITEVIAHHLSYTVERPYRNCCSPWITSRPATLLEVKRTTGWWDGAKAAAFRARATSKRT
jgi:hypothetical protein